MPTQSFQYDIKGNITYKSDVGNYTYGAGNAGPHAVTSAASDNYTYDATGNMLTGGGRTVTYNTFRKPLTLSKGTHTSTFTYGPDRSHYKRVDADGTTVKTTLSIGNVEFISHSSGVTETKRYIGDIAVVTTASNASPSTHYLHKDTLGSTDIVTNAVGSVVAEMSFDAFGKRRNVLTLAALAEAQYDPLNALTTQGFTGHEMVDEVGIIHMGGRIYDPGLGRFLSVDPYVQEPLNTQNLNRYSYALNSPLAYTDPTGFNFVSSLTSYSTDEHGITITQTATIWYAPVYMGEGVDLSWFEVRREYSYHVSLPNGVEASGISSVPIGFDVVYAAYDIASAAVSRREDYVLNLNSPTINPGTGGWSAIDAGEDVWLSVVFTVAGMTGRHEPDRDALNEELYAIFSDWFRVVLASNVADIEALDSPVGNAQISSPFRAIRTCSGCSEDHPGTDYAVPIGTSVVSTATGRVVRAYESTTFGNTVIVDHGPSSLGNGNVYTLYAHGSKILVSEGQQVTLGQEILLSGNTAGPGRTTDEHLHYEVIQTTSKPFEQGFFRNVNERHAPTDLKNLL